MIEEEEDYPGGWFGESWGAAVCEEDYTHRATPIGERCTDCGRSITEGDQGLIIPHVYAPGQMRLTVTHKTCFLRGLGQ